MIKYPKSLFLLVTMTLLASSVQAADLLGDAVHWLATSFGSSEQTAERRDGVRNVETELSDEDAQQSDVGDDTGELSGDQVGNQFFGVREASEAEEQARLHNKFTQDKIKINLAIKNTKQLIEQSQERVYLPELYLRLSELYIEESRIVYFLRRTEPDASKATQLSSLESNALKIQAIEVYKRIISHYPNYKSLDKVYFFMAHEFRELNRLSEMVEQYQLLIKHYPSSEYVPESLLLLGDYYVSVSDLDLARQQYEAVLNYPKSSAIDIARYKLAWVHINKKDFGAAIKLFEESVTGVSAGMKLDVDTYNRVDIRLESLNDMAFSYSEHFKNNSPQDAAAYFQKYAWSRPAYVTVVEKLAYRFLIKKKWQHAAYLYRELSALQHDPDKLLEYAENIFICVNESHSYDNADQDVRIIVDALRSQRYTVHTKEKDKQELMTRYELYARDVSTKLHEKSRHSALQKDFATAADAYKTYLEFFDNSPAYDSMQANYAETLFSAKRYAEAGKVYEKVARKLAANSDPKLKEQHLYSATLSYYEALKNRQDLNYYQVAQARSGLKTTGTLYAAQYPNSNRVANVLFNVAWIKHDEGNYRESIADFKDYVARFASAGNSNRKEIEAAVQLIVDAYHTLEDYEGLSQYGAAVAANTLLDGQIKSTVAQIVKAGESKIISGLIISSVEDWSTGKDQMQDYARQHQSSGLGEQALNALFVASKENADMATLLSSGSDFVAQYPQSKSTENILKVMIETALKSGQYRTLVGNLESFATLFPKHASSADFLYQAAQLRESMNQYQLASHNYQQLLSSFRISQDMHRSSILAIAGIAQKLGQVGAAIKVLSDNRKLFDQQGQMELDARVATLYLQQGEAKQAYDYQNQALASYKKFQQHSPELVDDLAEFEYSSVIPLTEMFFATQLKGVIDDSIVASKTKQFEELQKGYLAVMNYQSPSWSVLACYRLYEAHTEYAQFLKNAPLPELTEEEAQEYRQLIGETAQGYVVQANKYLQTGKDLAEKLLSFDPALNRYIAASDELATQVRSFDTDGQLVEIEKRALQEQELKELHTQLLKQPDDAALQISLAKAYQHRKDYRQAIVMVKGALNRAEALDTSSVAKVYTILGAAYLGIGEDHLAKESFAKALDADPKRQDALLNLAALYQHYGHQEEANRLYESVDSVSSVQLTSDLLLPRAKALFEARNIEPIQVSR